MDNLTLLGTVGGVILVFGAAYPDRPGIKPIKSVKDWLFAIGGICTFLYSIVGYFQGASVFFVFLQALVNLSSIFMMTDLDERIGTPIVALAGFGLIVWSFRLDAGVQTAFFVLGLAGIAVGYCSKGGTSHRALALFLGSALISFFSYLQASWVFFWLNLFFALFSMLQFHLLTRPRPR